MKPTTVIFDMDGVILDSEPISLHVLDKMYDELGIDVPLEVKYTMFGRTMLDWWKFLVDKYNITDFTPEELAQKQAQGILDFYDTEDMDSYFFSSLENVLKELKRNGIKTAVASSSPLKTIKKVLDMGNLTDYFDLIVSGSEPYIKRGKPEPDIFLYAADKLGSKPEECIVVEDSESGLLAAKKANMTTLGFLSSPKYIIVKDADYLFLDYEDFFDVAEGLIDKED